MTTIILVLSIGTLALLSYTLIFRPLIRKSRLTLFKAKLNDKVEAFKTAFPQYNYSAQQNDLRRNILQLEMAGRVAAEAERKATDIPFPTLDAPKPTESSSAMIDRITALFKADSAMMLANYRSGTRSFTGVD